ncbi:hypothetical protein FB565_007411 [Actinoplanes lutulentus]|uniref:Uncharacterized protein n=1 Tax=Actinoplanes lutulentus TaxID=1287878 RepID=A0A327Z8Y7_9ACTN|nr:hypothetical protein [Actinoplanes lutulentus]MBB2947640.1 hypothetical protein [Actinoplanes lutulentus]RAK27697.1 hypothetical protein B0I29_12280 [Actinoplanes lutulentus]
MPTSTSTDAARTGIGEDAIPYPCCAYGATEGVAYAQTARRPARFHEGEPGDHLEYQVTLWPASAEAGVRVLKHGKSPWAY